MIRKMLNGDIDRVADIWLKINLKAHYFISNQYWKSNYEKGSLFNVKAWMKLLVKKNTLCYGNENRNRGFNA